MTLSSLVGHGRDGAPGDRAPAGAEPAENLGLRRAGERDGAGRVMTSATGTISTVQDSDGDNETFTVSLGTLPAGVVAGSPTSATVTIIDHTKGTVRVTVTKDNGLDGSRKGRRSGANVRADPAPSFDHAGQPGYRQCQRYLRRAATGGFSSFPKGAVHAVHLIPTIDDGIDGVDGRSGGKVGARRRIHSGWPGLHDRGGGQQHRAAARPADGEPGGGRRTR